MRNAINFANRRIGEFAAACRTYCRRYCTANEEEYRLPKKKKIIHPYRQIHPWESKKEFADNLVKNVIYNKDGLIAINKPYGIAVSNIQQQNQLENKSKRCHMIVGEVNYSIKDVLLYLAKELDVPQLIPCTGAEKYMTGIYVFGTDDKVCKQVDKAKKRISHGLYRKYWVVTTRVPNTISGKHHLAMTLKTSPKGGKKPVIVTKWSNNAIKRDEAKILNINYKILSNSTYNLSSLIEIDASTRKWHSIRLFASTMLYSPILGDNYHGSRVYEMMGTWMKVDPFAESTLNFPKINKELLNLLNVRESQQEIIPTHIHMRSMILPSFGVKKEDLILEAPIIHPFDWTCKQLMFKNVSYADDGTEQETVNNNEVVTKAETICG